MAVIRCPACDALNSSAQEDVWLFKRLRCVACGVLMEITHEHPLTAEWVPESWSFANWILQDCLDEEAVDTEIPPKVPWNSEFSKPTSKQRKRRKGTAKESRYAQDHLPRLQQAKQRQKHGAQLGKPHGLSGVPGAGPGRWREATEIDGPWRGARAAR